MNSDQTMSVDISKHNELVDIIDDMVQYWCDEHVCSGELAWTILQCYSTAKLAQLSGEIE